LKVLDQNDINVTLVREPNSDGTIPWKALAGRSNLVNVVKEPMFEGTVPVKEL
jgi:hypothetical protein